MLIRTLLFFTVTAFCSLQAGATSVLPVSLQQLSSAAELIFHGTAISNEVRLDEVSGRVATFTTFAVTDVIKGVAGDTHTIKQIGGQLPGSRVRQIIRGVPRFSVGAEYVVFLPPASSLGFSSPIGLSQGRFPRLPASTARRRPRSFRQRRCCRPCRVSRQAQAWLNSCGSCAAWRETEPC